METNPEDYFSTEVPSKPVRLLHDFMRDKALDLITRRIGQIDYNQDRINMYRGDGKMFLREREEKKFLEYERKGVVLPGLTGVFRAASTIWAIARVSPKLLLPEKAAARPTV